MLNHGLMQLACSDGRARRVCRRVGLSVLAVLTVATLVLAGGDADVASAATTVPTAASGKTAKPTTTKKGSSGKTTSTLKSTQIKSTVTIPDVTGKGTTALLRVAVSDVFRAAKSGDFAVAKDGVALTEGDRLKTNGNGRGTVNFSDGSLLRVAGTAEITVAAVAVSSGARKVNVNLTTGDVYAKVAKATGSNSEWTVNTPVATASVRGTAFVVSCVPRQCTFSVAEGVVEVTNPSGTVQVSAGNQTTAITGQAPTPPSALASTADGRGGQWLLCNAERDAIPTQITGVTASDCQTVVGPVVQPLVVGSSTPTTVAGSTSTLPTATTAAVPTTVGALPVVPSSYTGTGGLAGTLSENPFRCDGGVRTMIVMTGFNPSEPVTFTSPQYPGGLPSNVSRANGVNDPNWTCGPGNVGTVWTITATGSSGRSITFQVVGGPA